MASAPFAALLLVAMGCLAAAAPQPMPCKPHPCPSPGLPQLPAASYKIGLTFDSSALRYLMSVSVGTPPQSTQTVTVDTGSGSFYDVAYNPSTSKTATNMKKTGILGYSSGPIGPAPFYRDVVSLPVTPLGSASASSLSIKRYRWIQTPSQSRDDFSLMGWSPPGWNLHAIAQPNASLIAGALCNSQTVPCGNIPTAPQALLTAAKLQPMFSISLDANPPSTSSQEAGKILLGGVDASLASTTAMIPTPITPNLHRTDFATGSNKYVFWQFNPLNITIIKHDGSGDTICAENDVTSKQACTIIVDSGYSHNCVKDDTARQKMKDATDPSHGTCAQALLVYLPTQKRGGVPVPLTIPLTKDQSGDCSKLTFTKDDWVRESDKNQGAVPPNWFVWGQPMLRQLYVGFSFNAYKTGGLFFAPRS